MRIGISIKQIIYSVFALLTGILLSCNNRQPAEITYSTDSVQIETTVVKPATDSCITLPDMQLEQERFGGQQIHDGKKLSAMEINDLQLAKIDTVNVFDYPGIGYYYLKDLYENENGVVLLLSRTYEMENIAWIAAYDKNRHLIDFRRVFYDEFAESFLKTITVIVNNVIAISSYAYNSGSGEDEMNIEKYCILNNLHFKKVE